MKSNYHRYVLGVVTIGLAVQFLTSAFSGVVLAQPNSIVETESANLHFTNDVRLLPESIDLSDNDYFPPIRSQGDKNSCSAWSMVYYSLGYREALNRQWVNTHTDDSQLLSPDFSYNIGNGGLLNEFGLPEGVSRTEIGNIIEDWGTPSWSAMPYNDEVYLDWGSQSAWSEAPLHRANYIKNIPFDENNKDDIITKIKQELDGGYLPTFTLNVGSDDKLFSSL